MLTITRRLQSLGGGYHDGDGRCPNRNLLVTNAKPWFIGNDKNSMLDGHHKLFWLSVCLKDLHKIVQGRGGGVGLLF